MRPRDDDFLHSAAPRALEIVCGIVLFGFVLIFGFVIALVAQRAGWEFGPLAFIFALALLGWFLLSVAWRLLTGRAHPAGGLLSPAAITVGAFIFALAGALFIYIGITERSVAAIVSGVANFPICYVALRLARSKRRRSDG